MMKKLITVIGVTFLLGACGSPQGKVEASCKKMFKTMEDDGSTDVNKVCGCIGDDLAQTLDKKQLSSMAKIMGKVKSEDDLESMMTKSPVLGASMMGAMKNCAI